MLCIQLVPADQQPSMLCIQSVPADKQHCIMDKTMLNLLSARPTKRQLICCTPVAEGCGPRL